MNKVNIIALFSFVLICSISFAQSSSEKYLYRQALVKDAKTDELIEDLGYGNKGVIIYFRENKEEWISITLGTEEAYTVKVVQTIDDYPEKDMHVEMKKEQ